MPYNTFSALQTGDHHLTIHLHCFDYLISAATFTHKTFSNSLIHRFGTFTHKIATIECHRIVMFTVHVPEV